MESGAGGADDPHSNGMATLPMMHGTESSRVCLDSALGTGPFKSEAAFCKVSVPQGIETCNEM